MLEARAFLDDFDELGTLFSTLEDIGADQVGSYAIHDTVFRHRNPAIPLDQEFLRLRYMPENIWPDEEPWNLTIKLPEALEFGKDSHITRKEQFKNQQEACAYHDDQGFADTYKYAFDFWRIGWQYTLGVDVVDLEILEIEELAEENPLRPTAEIKSATASGLVALAQRLAINRERFIAGPLVAELDKIYERSKPS